MNRRRLLYPLIAAALAGGILLYDRMTSRAHRPPAGSPPRAPAGPIPYDGPLEMRPAPPAPPPTPPTPKPER